MTRAFAPMETEKTPLRSVSYTPIASNDPGYLLPVHSSNRESTKPNRHGPILLLFVSAAAAAVFLIAVWNSGTTPLPIETAAWSSVAPPFSTVNPVDVNFSRVDRPFTSMPGPIFDAIRTKNIPLPTNGWYENFFLGLSNTDADNSVFQVPYILDTAGFLAGIRTHPCHVQANDRTVMMTYEPENGLSLGAVETFYPQHYVRSQGIPAISKLAVELEWSTGGAASASSVDGPMMRAPVVRGAPYTSMAYITTTPRIFAERPLRGDVIIDNDPSKVLRCGDGFGKFTAPAVRVESELKFQLDISDMTWLVFLSEPMDFKCASQSVEGSEPSLPPGVVGPPASPQLGSNFELRATAPLRRGMVRIAMANNCTTGQSRLYCPTLDPVNQSEYESLLRAHADIYPTSKADVQFTFPVQSEEEEELRLILDWKPSLMSEIAGSTGSGDDDSSLQAVESDDDANGIPKNELLMIALPHQQERVRGIIGSSNRVLSAGCSPTIHGRACPILGRTWSMVEHLHRVNFSASHPVRPEMLSSIHKALRTDITYRLPANYLVGAGDTYFSGKMLAKQARILIIAEEVGGVSKRALREMVDSLRGGVEIWLNGSAQSPLLYDPHWGGIVMCGCDYVEVDGVGSCGNRRPDCPALSDAGQNFGAGFYNDHHFHFGYHIYAAAVLAKFDPEWGRRFHQHVLMLVRDIANPSDSDGYFPTWRHKDWYLGFSWASGIVTINGQPYPNGRNQESSSEAISAYEAVALYGMVMGQIYGRSDSQEDKALCEAAGRIADMGRLLAATEVRSAITYWHVQSPDSPGVARIYPDIYAPKVVGMMWSLLAQEQTWFGAQPWKSYGIQLMPITPLSEARDTPGWVSEMLPIFSASCSSDPDCVNQGWGVLVYACMATVGEWEAAWRLAEQMTPDMFTTAGGNGHSLSNTLWYIATRPDTNITSTR